MLRMTALDKFLRSSKKEKSNQSLTKLIDMVTLFAQVSKENGGRLRIYSFKKRKKSSLRI